MKQKLWNLAKKYENHVVWSVIVAEAISMILTLALCSTFFMYVFLIVMLIGIVFACCHAYLECECEARLY